MSFNTGIRASVASPYAIQDNVLLSEKKIKDDLTRIFKETLWGKKPDVEELSYLYLNTFNFMEIAEKCDHYKEVVSLLGEGVLPILEGRQTSIQQLLKGAPKSIQDTAICAILTIKRYNVVKYVCNMILSLAFAPSDENIRKAMSVVLHANGYFNRSNIIPLIPAGPFVVLFSNDKSLKLSTFLWGDKLIEKVKELNDVEKGEEESIEKKRKIAE